MKLCAHIFLRLLVFVQAQEDRDTLKKQAEGVQKEYDRVCELLKEVG